MRNRLLLLLILTIFLASHRLAQQERHTVQAQIAPATGGASTQPVVPVTGGAPNGVLVDPVLSADAGIVAFASRSTNLMPAAAADSGFDLWHIYAYDRGAERLERISVGPHGQLGNASSGGSPPAISADGRFVVFTSRADNLVLGDTNNAADVFVRDRQTHQTTRVSVSSAGAQGNRDSFLPAISADGRVVAFVSQATNLVPGDTNNAADVFVHDRQTGQTSRVSVATGGGQANGSSGLSAPALSSDGRFVAFASAASNLVAHDSNSAADVFVHDRQTGATTRVSVATGNGQANGASTAPALSGDGRYVAFLSTAANLTATGSNGQSHVYLHDRQRGSTERLSIAHDGAPANRESYAPRISADGRFVAFASAAENLVAGDTNQTLDVFLHDGLSGQIERISVFDTDTQANGASWRPALDAIGRYVAFESIATNPAPAFFTLPSGGLSNLYLRDRGPQATGAYTITGQIVDADDAPVAGIDVTVGRRFPRRAQSDTLGRFTVANLPAGPYVVDVDAPNHALWPASPLVVTVEETPDSQTLPAIRAYACRAPSGLNLCALRPGDILLELTPDGADWPQVGGSYFTRAGLFVGIQDDGPRLIHVIPHPPLAEENDAEENDAEENDAEDNDVKDSDAENNSSNDATPPAWAIVESSLLDAPIWRDPTIADWAVNRPAVGPLVAQRAAARGRALAANSTLHYRFYDSDEQSPLNPQDAARAYDALLIVRAYAQAGHAFALTDPTGPAGLQGWITPDHLYRQTAHVQRRLRNADERALFFRIESGPVHLTLVGENGMRMGHNAPEMPQEATEDLLDLVDPSTLAPRLYLYSGEDARVESLAVARLDARVAWRLEISGNRTSSFVVVWGEIAPNAPFNIVGGVLRAGETRAWPLTELTPDRTLYIPGIRR